MRFALSSFVIAVAIEKKLGQSIQEIDQREREHEADQRIQYHLLHSVYKVRNICGCDSNESTIHVRILRKNSGNLAWSKASSGLNAECIAQDANQSPN